ncbi:hypothetical protein R1flu_001897 [Riccia fluitans]|uniref:Uncharacterized protein n=1 Tax=Riccia fluitans TaxID=41844 RepID=A0ABD1Y7X0_9MARC
MQPDVHPMRRKLAVIIFGVPSVNLMTCGSLPKGKIGEMPHWQLPEVPVPSVPGTGKAEEQESHLPTSGSLPEIEKVPSLPGSGEDEKQESHLPTPSFHVPSLPVIGKGEGEGGLHVPSLPLTGKGEGEGDLHVPSLPLIGKDQGEGGLQIPSLPLIGKGEGEGGLHVPSLPVIGKAEGEGGLRVPSLPLIGKIEGEDGLQIPAAVLPLVGKGEGTGGLHVPSLPVIGKGEGENGLQIPSLPLIGKGEGEGSLHVPSLPVIGKFQGEGGLQIPSLPNLSVPSLPIPSLPIPDLPSLPLGGDDGDIEQMVRLATVKLLRWLPGAMLKLTAMLPKIRKVVKQLVTWPPTMLNLVIIWVSVVLGSFGSFGSAMLLTFLSPILVPASVMFFLTVGSGLALVAGVLAVVAAYYKLLGLPNSSNASQVPTTKEQQGISFRLPRLGASTA